MDLLFKIFNLHLHIVVLADSLADLTAVLLLGLRLLHL